MGAGLDPVSYRLGGGIRREPPPQEPFIGCPAASVGEENSNSRTVQGTAVGGGAAHP